MKTSLLTALSSLLEEGEDDVEGLRLEAAVVFLFDRLVALFTEGFRLGDFTTVLSTMLLTRSYVMDIGHKYS